MQGTQKRVFAYCDIPLDEVHAIDLRESICGNLGAENERIAASRGSLLETFTEECIKGSSMTAHLITIREGDDEQPLPERATALYNEKYGQLGIAWGADARSPATWADVDDLESGIEMWLNNPEEWEQRN